ncbi:MAG TPA: prolipoprotein diacylglyceryl transferase family protein [Patescibacteria group bacterium]|nr:prolipoprotein diacylglyceryl transferase family protein [Patescibacteria group bacterium]
MTPIFIQKGIVQIAFYSVFVTLGFFLASFVIWRNMKKAHYAKEEPFDLLFVCTLGFLIGARAIYILMHPEAFGWNVLTWFSIFSNVGFSLTGGIVGGAVALWVFSNKKRWNIWEIGDFVVPAVILTETFESLGCFFSGCRYGKLSSLPWAVEIVGVYGRRHPVQIYAALLLLLLLLGIALLRKRVRPDGFFVPVYLIGWGIIHSLIAFWQEQSVYFGRNNWSQLFSVTLIAVGVILLRMRHPHLMNEWTERLGVTKAVTFVLQKIQRKK